MEPQLTSDERQLLDRFLTGDLRDDERDVVRRLFDQHPNEDAFYTAWRDALRTNPQFGMPPTSSHSFATLKRRIEESAVVALPSGVAAQHLRRKKGIDKRNRSVGTRTLRGGVWLAGAVVAAVLTVIALGGTSHPRTIRSYTTSAGQHATLTLADGTRVSLGQRTTLRLLNFETHARTVAVDGEAYFEVAHVADVPFLVRTGVVTTRVLGTSFMVQYMAGRSRVHVAVTEGKVRVTSPLIPSSSGVTLGAGMMSDVVDSVVRVKTVNEMAPGAEWVRDELVFHDTPVSAVLQTMTRWYGYHFQSPDSTLLRQKVTIGVPMRSSETAFAILEDILSVNLAVSGDTVTLVPHPARSEKKMPRIRMYDVWTPAREVGR